MGTGGLVARARAGDRDALAEMYRDYGERIHDFCYSLLRDREEAADAMHDTFVLATQRIAQLRDPERLTAWLFAIARHVSFRRLDQRRRFTPTAQPPEIAIDDDAFVELVQQDAVALVWDALAGLSQRDQAVLTLNLRHGLDGADLAAAVGVVHANPYSLLHRAKTHLERAVGVLLVARNGSPSCAALATLVADWDGALTPLLRKRIGRHIDECAECERTRARVQPIAVLSAIPLLRADRAEAMFADMVAQHAAAGPLHPERWRRDGFPPAIDERGRRRVVAMAAGVVALGVVAVVLVAPAGNGSTADAGGGRNAARRESVGDEQAAASLTASTHVSGVSSSVAAAPPTTTRAPNLAVVAPPPTPPPPTSPPPTSPLPEGAAPSPALVSDPVATNPPATTAPATTVPSASTPPTAVPTTTVPATLPPD